MFVEFRKKHQSKENDDINCSRLRVIITVQMHNLMFACKYNRRALRKVTSSFEEVLYINAIALESPFTFALPIHHTWIFFPVKCVDVSIVDSTASSFTPGDKTEFHFW